MTKSKSKKFTRKDLFTEATERVLKQYILNYQKVSNDSQS